MKCVNLQQKGVRCSVNEVTKLLASRYHCNKAVVRKFLDRAYKYRLKSLSLVVVLCYF